MDGDNNIRLEFRELDVRIRFTFTKREVYVIAVYNIRGYITHEGCVSEKYSSKKRRYKKSFKCIIGRFNL